MLHLDLLTSYVICGAGSLVGAGLMLLAESDDPATRRAILFYAAGFALVGIGLFQLGYVSDDGGERHPALLVSTVFSLVGLCCFGAAFSWLAGRAPPRGTLAGSAALVVILCVGWTRSSQVFSGTYSATMMIVSLAVTWSQRRAVLGAAPRAERAVAVSVALFAISWGVRLVATLCYTGPRRFDIGYVPEAMMPYLGAFYGIVPIVIAALALNVVNSRLATRLRALAGTDELTGAWTRRALREMAPQVMARERARGQRVATLMVDIDHFKRVNDEHGHGAGDSVLKRAAELLRLHVRRDAVVTRYGGEEFAILMPVADLEEARRAAERLRAAFEGETHALGIAGLRVTISAGVVLVEEGESLDAALARADEALYRAKRSGRNRVELEAAAA